MNEIALTDTHPNHCTRTRSWIGASGVLCIAFPLWYLALGFFLDQNTGQIPYFITEYMTTYSGGFVRRGVLGEILFWGSDCTGVGPLELLHGFRMTLGTTFFALLGLGVFRNRWKLGFSGTLTVLLSPMIASVGWQQLGSIDLFFILLTTAHACLAARCSESIYFWSTLALFAVVGSFVGLSHEGFLLLGLPLNVIISIKKIGFKFPQLMTLFMGPLVACGLGVIANGSQVQADAISGAWLMRGIEVPSNSAIAYLGKHPSQELRFVASNLSVTSLLRWGVSLFGSGLSLVLLWRALPIPVFEKRSLLVNYLLIPTLATTPLYFIGVDYNRWISIPVCSGVMAILFSNSLKSNLIIPPRDKKLWVVAIVLGACVIPAAPYFTWRSTFGGPVRASFNLLRESI